MKEKIKLDFLRFFDNPLSKYRIVKISYFFHAMVVLGYLEQLKRGLGLAFVAHFLHDF